MAKVESSADGALVVPMPAAGTRGRWHSPPPRRRLSLEERVVRLEVLGRPRLQPAPHAVGQRHAERVGHLGGDVGLDLKTLVSEASNRWPQRVRSGLTRVRLHQLGLHPHPARGAAAFSQRTVPVSR